jgi:hypothetical protein
MLDTGCWIITEGTGKEKDMILDAGYWILDKDKKQGA